MPKKLNPTNGIKTGQGSYAGPTDGAGSRGTSKSKLNPTNGSSKLKVMTGQSGKRGPMNGTRGPTSTK
jgi:hypothetical protein